MIDSGKWPKSLFKAKIVTFFNPFQVISSRMTVFNSRLVINI